MRTNGSVGGCGHEADRREESPRRDGRACSGEEGARCEKRRHCGRRVSGGGKGGREGVGRGERPLAGRAGGPTRVGQRAESRDEASGVPKARLAARDKIGLGHEIRLDGSFGAGRRGRSHRPRVPATTELRVNTDRCLHLRLSHRRSTRPLPCPRLAYCSSLPQRSCRPDRPHSSPWTTRHSFTPGLPSSPPR